MRWASNTIELDDVLKGETVKAPFWSGESRRGSWIKIPGPWRHMPQQYDSDVAVIIATNKGRALQGLSPLALPDSSPEASVDVVRRTPLVTLARLLRGHLVRATIEPAPFVSPQWSTAPSIRIDIVGALVLRHPSGVLRFWVHDLATVARWHS